MQDDTFRVGRYEYSRLGDAYYRWKVGEIAFGKKVQKEITEKVYQKQFEKYNKGAKTDRRTRTQYNLDTKWKKELWAKSEFKNSPWNTEGRQLHQRYRPLTINDKKPIYSRVFYDEGKRANVKDKWASIGNRKNAKKVVYILNGTKEWLRHIQIAKYQMVKQAENFRVVVGQKALRVFQLSFKYHKFYNEDTQWRALAEYTRNKRIKRHTWFGEHKSKLYETGKLSLSLSNLDDSGNLISRVTTNKVTVNRTAQWGSKGVRKTKRGKKLWNHRIEKGADYSSTFSYAGIHNEGVPKGRKPGAKIPQRQFMGWSKLRSGKMDKVDTFAYKIADRYLFDSVFMVKQH